MLPKELCDEVWEGGGGRGGAGGRRGGLGSGGQLPRTENIKRLHS